MSVGFSFGNGRFSLNSSTDETERGRIILQNKQMLFIGICMTLFFIQCPDKSESLRFLWIDASANFERLSDRQKINAIMEKIRGAGFTDIIVDLKPISGEVLYDSEWAGRVLEWKGQHREADFDYPAVMIEEARRRRLGVYAAMNVFSEGWKTERRGTIYSDHPEWQTMLYTPQGIVKTEDYPVGYAAFVNPLIPEVREHEIELMEEIFTRYDFDGIVLDRARYDNIQSDFSDVSRQAFETFLGKEVGNWPEDIFRWVEKEGAWDYIPGQYFKAWIHWRAEIIHDFFIEARDRVKQCRPDAAFSTYVGAWYPSYYELGVNWASSHYDPSKDYSWADSSYAETGYAESLDFLFAGCYFYPVAISEICSHGAARRPNQEAGMESEIKSYHTVEGSAKLAKEVTREKIPLYGSLYVQQYKDRENPVQFQKAMQMVLKETDGIMIFDLVHLEMFSWWDELRQVLAADELADSAGK